MILFLKRNDIIFKKKSLNGKSDKLKNLGFTSVKLFMSDLMCHENHQLLHSAWFFSNCIYIKVGENSDATKIKHVYDIEKALIWRTLIPILESMSKFP